MLLSKINKVPKGNLCEFAWQPFHYSLSCTCSEPNFFQKSKQKGKAKMSKKLKQAKVNFYPEQHEKLQAMAKANDSTISQFIREQIDFNLSDEDIKKRYKKHNPNAHKKADPKLIYEIAKIGNNLNQIAKYINTKKNDVNTIQILESLVSIEKEIKSLL